MDTDRCASNVVPQPRNTNEQLFRIIGTMLESRNGVSGAVQGRHLASEVTVVEDQ